MTESPEGKLTPEQALKILIQAAMRHLIELPDPRDRDAVLEAIFVVERTYQ